MKRLPTANGPSTLPAINQRRLMRDLNAIGRIGIGNRGGVTRLVFSIKELRSRQVLIHLMRQAGLKIHIDGIGNIFGRLEGRDAKGPAVLSGSHLDTVIHGGKYDGPVGVIGALEAVRTICENRIPHPLAARSRLLRRRGVEPFRLFDPRQQLGCRRSPSERLDQRR